MVHYSKQQINSCVQGGKQSQAVTKNIFHSNSSEIQIRSKFHTDYLHSGTMHLETFQKQTQTVHAYIIRQERGIVTTNNRERDSDN